MKRVIWPGAVLAGVLAVSCEDRSSARPTEEEGGLEEESRWGVPLADPGRGFYRHTERHGAAEAGLAVGQLRAWREQGTTLVMRVFYLEEFRDAAISGAYLKAMAGDFAVMREAGVKGVVRFTYTAEMNDGGASQAGEERVLEHLAALAPVLGENRDVIHCVQAGFLGAWGEWHSVHPDYQAEDGSLDPDACRRFMTALLKVVPKPLFVQVRTPWQKMMLFEPDDPLGSRVGHHNDCFLASANDCGTYRNVRGETAWLEEETRSVPMGGETCGMNPPRSSGRSALREMERLHYNYLNADYHPEVLKAWRAEGCHDEITARLGHRVRLMGVELRGERVRVTLVNEGFAAPLYEREMEYRWRGESGEVVGKVEGFSMRALIPGEKWVVEVPAGAGELDLRWPDAAPGLRGRGEYALWLANPGMPRDAAGWHRVVVNSNLKS